MEHEGKGKEWSAADFSKHFKGVKFPAKKRDLVNHAKTQGVDDKDFINWLNHLDDNKEYHGVDDLMKEYGRKAA